MNVKIVIAILAVIIIASGNFMVYQAGYQIGAMDTENRYEPVISEYRDAVHKGVVGFKPPADEYEIVGNVSGNFTIAFHEWDEPTLICPDNKLENCYLSKITRNETTTSQLNISVVKVKEGNLDHIYAFVVR